MYKRQVYNYIHIGNARPICVFDVLRRYMEYRGLKVTYVQNFTDVDDKIIRKANEENSDYLTVSPVSYTHLAMQGRVYSIRNALQFFTIPLGYLMGGMAVDWIFEPLMQVQSKGSLLVQLFGQGKGTGAALLYSILAICGIGTCLVFRRDKHIWLLEQKSSSK